LSNAGRFTDKGGVTVSVAHSGDVVKVSVTDTGAGIPFDRQKEIFEPFQQIDSSIPRQGGSGLGLSISKRFVDLHNGKMWFESQPGSGTTFFFILPLSEPIQTATVNTGYQRWITPYHQPEKEFRKSKAPLPVLIPRFVLLDDYSTLTKLFNHYTEEIEIVSTNNIENAIKELSNSPSQALIINRPSPEIVIKQIDLPSDIPIITCWIPATDERTRSSGAIDYLIKPIDRERLFSVIHNIDQKAKKILLVDDDNEVLQLFARMLKSGDQNFTILRARTGQRALEMMHERTPDIVLLDLIMPGMDGFQVLERKNADAKIKDIPVVIVSSRDPSGSPLVSNTIVIGKKGGFSVRELLDCMKAFSSVVAPETRITGQVHSGLPRV
jgi:CheY-like chemotaxis protein